MTYHNSLRRFAPCASLMVAEPTIGLGSADRGTWTPAFCVGRAGPWKNAAVSALDKSV